MARRGWGCRDCKPADVAMTQPQGWSSPVPNAYQQTGGPGLATVVFCVLGHDRADRPGRHFARWSGPKRKTGSLCAEHFKCVEIGDVQGKADIGYFHPVTGILRPLLCYNGVP
jgi:hypothetical protein